MCIYDADVIRIAIKILGQNKINAFNCKAYTGKYLRYDFFLPFFAYSNYHRVAAKSVTEKNEMECPKTFSQSH